ncbi:MAG: hypothetical protein R3E94_01145 [Burkholderiaceae bacterium]
MKYLFLPLLWALLTGGLLPLARAEDAPAVPLEAKATVVILSPMVEEAHLPVHSRLRDSLQAFEPSGAEAPSAYPYRLSADERKRMREQLRGQAPAYRSPPQ